MSNVTRMRRVLLLALPLALLAGPASAVQRAPMSASGGSQDGWVMHAADYRSEGRHDCNATIVLGTGAYPTPVRHDGSALTWRIEDPRRPALAAVSRGHGAHSYDVRTESVATTLEPVRSRGRTVAWLVRTKPTGYGDLRLTLTVLWPEDACGQDHLVMRYHALALPV